MQKEFFSVIEKNLRKEKPDSSIKDDEPPQCTVIQPITKVPFENLEQVKKSACWYDWKWHIANRIRSFSHLKSIFPELFPSEDLDSVTEIYPMAITPYYASLIKKADYSDPIYKMSIASSQELYDPSFLGCDPLAEENTMPVPNLIHRYGDRALLMATDMCSMYCRYCTRKRMAGCKEKTISKPVLDKIVEYLKLHSEIKDVIISGGDPLTMTTERLEEVVRAVRGVESVDIIRIGTKVPVVLPQRIDKQLIDMLKKYQPIWINTHFNHPAEITPEAKEACAMIVDGGIPLGNQSVLLKGVNDDPFVMEQLCRSLTKIRVRPYYLFQCDLVKGVEHFRTSLTKGIEIMEYLRGRISGFAIPMFILDAPNGGGKIPILPNYIVSQSPTHIAVRTYEGKIVSYPEPLLEKDSRSPIIEAEKIEKKVRQGVWNLIKQ